MSASNRGRYAEGKVREFLKAWAEAHANFCFNRILDAHSALGAMANPQPGDFQWFKLVDGAEIWLDERMHPFTRNGLIEVKEVNHANRLPYKNFAPDQVGRMRIRQMAGSEPLVLVCHRTSSGNYWRAPDFDFWLERDATKPSGSWDLTDIEFTKNVGDILRSYLA